MARLERILYRSEATGSTASLLNVATILAESQRNNDRDGLTGALVAHDNHYVQILEGPSDQLDRLLDRLEGDPRHRRIEVLQRGPVESRSFAAWSMAHARITPELEPMLRIVSQGGTPERLIETMRAAAAA